MTGAATAEREKQNQWGGWLAKCYNQVPFAPEHIWSLRIHLTSIISSWSSPLLRFHWNSGHRRSMRHRDPSSRLGAWFPDSVFHCVIITIMDRFAPFLSSRLPYFLNTILKSINLGVLFHYQLCDLGRYDMDKQSQREAFTRLFQGVFHLFKVYIWIKSLWSTRGSMCS